MDDEATNASTGSANISDLAGDAAEGSVTLDGASLDSITAQTVIVNQGNIGSVQAFDVSVRDGGIGRAEAGQIQVMDGGIGIARATSLGLSEGAASIVLAQSADLRDSSVALLIARSVSGDARVLIDMRAGAALGLVFGLTVAGLKLLLDRRRA